MTDERTSIAARLRAAREQAGLSQGQVAKLMGVHRPTISEIEAGRRRVQLEELNHFAKLYQVTTQWLTESPSPGDDLRAAKVQLAARELSSLRPDDLDRVLNLLKSLQPKEGDR